MRSKVMYPLPVALLLGMFAFGGEAGAQTEAGKLSLSLGLPGQPAAPQATSPQPPSDGIALQRTESVNVSDASPSSAPSPQQLLERAQYWEDHGRSDLAARIRSRVPQEAPARAPALTPPPAPPRSSFVMDTSLPATPSATANTAAPEPRLSLSPQALEQEAHYWEAHGRDDLAAKLRQRLQAMEAASPAPTPAMAAPSPQRPPATPPNSAPLYRSANTSTALENSLLKEPGNLNTRLDLVQIYRSTGELAKARAQVDSLLAASPDLPAALFASAQIYADQRLWRETLDTLEKITPSARTAPMIELQKMAWAHVQLDRADALVKEGRNAEAEILLRQVALELSITPNPALLAEPPPLWKTATTKATGKRKR